MNYKVYDNFLPYDQFDYIAKTVVRNDFIWNFNKSVAFLEDGEDPNWYFTHCFYDNGMPQCSFFNELFEFVQTPLKQKADVDIKAVLRIKSNLYPRTEKVVRHQLHSDYGFFNHSCLLGINDCDGYTIFENGDKIESKANRMLVFDGQLQHCSTTCTDQKVRLNINCNFL